MHRICDLVSDDDKPPHLQKSLFSAKHRAGAIWSYSVKQSKKDNSIVIRQCDNNDWKQKDSFSKFKTQVTT